jgi:hypothetical protein
MFLMSFPNRQLVGLVDKFLRKRQCYNCVTTPRSLIEIVSLKQFDQVIIKLTKRERATILAALRRWLSYPAAREADSVATNGGRQRPLDNAEIERLCGRISELAAKRDGAPVHRQSDNGARERKASRTAR